MLPVKGMLLLLAFAVSQVSAYWWSECYAEKEHPYLKMGTKTSYQYVERFGTLYEKVPGCYPVQIWMLMGEGTRYPTDGEIWQMQALRTLRDEIIENNEAKNSSYLCEADLKNLKEWSLDPMATRENAERLTEQGIEEFKLLAKRVKSNFPELFPPLMSETGSIKYKFRSMDGNKTTESLKAFMSGLFDKVDFPHNDTLFVVNGPCLDTFTNFLSEPSVFREGPEYQKLISDVSRRLGFLYSNLYSVQIQNMYNMCRYDKAWNIDAISPWCAVFNDEEMKVLEYDDDLQEYYNEVDWRKVGCPAMQDLFSHFEKLEGNYYYPDNPKAIFNFGRSARLSSFIDAIGFVKNSGPPLASSYHSRGRQAWRTSEIASFGGNAAAVFYKCDNPESPNKVMFYLAEKPVSSLDGCPGSCKWEYLKYRFEHDRTQCSSAYCYPNRVTSSFVSPTATLWLLLSALTSFCR